MSPCMIDFCPVELTRSQNTWCPNISAINIRKQQLLDKIIAPVMQWLKDGTKPSSHEIQQAHPEIRHLLELLGYTRVM